MTLARVMRRTSRGSARSFSEPGLLGLPPLGLVGFGVDASVVRGSCAAASRSRFRCPGSNWAGAESMCPAAMTNSLNRLHTHESIVPCQSTRVCQAYYWSAAATLMCTAEARTSLDLPLSSSQKKGCVQHVWRSRVAAERTCTGRVLPRQHLVNGREIAVVQMRNGRQIIIPAAKSSLASANFLGVSIRQPLAAGARLPAG